VTDTTPAEVVSSGHLHLSSLTAYSSLTLLIFPYGNLGRPDLALGLFRQHILLWFRLNVLLVLDDSS